MTSHPHARVELADGESHTIRYDFNAMADYEEAVGKPITQMGEGNVGMRELRALLWAGLLHKHPRLTLKQAGSLIPPERMAEVAEACGTALVRALGKPDPTKPATEPTDGASVGEARSPMPTRS